MADRLAHELSQDQETETRELVEWAEAEFWIPEGDGRLHIAPYQAACLREALRQDEAGLFVHSTIVWSDLKKSIKSTLAATVCLWWAVTHPWSSIKVVANDIKQADSRVGYYIRRAVELNPGYFQAHGVRMRASGHLIEFGNHSRIEAIPIDPTGEAGGNDDIVVYSELWGWKHQAARNMWTETTLSPMKFGKSLRWCETYAGFDGESPILEELYDQGVEQGRPMTEVFEELYVNEAARLLVLWNTTPRLPWQTEEYYAQEKAALTEAQYNRVHRNQWVGAETEFVSLAWWDACLDPLKLKPRSQGGLGQTPVIIGCDASVSGDCTALSMVTRHPDHPDEVVELYTAIWVPPKGGKMDYDATLTVEVERLVAEYNVVEVAYDEYQLHLWATQLRAKGAGWFRPFSQGTDRLIADKGLYDIIRDRRLHHSGNPELREHIGNCAAKNDTGQDSKLRLVKKASNRKIDGAVALSMAAAECLRLML